MRHYRKTAIMLALCLLAGTTSCGEKKMQQGLSSSDIELIEPVNTTANTEIVTYRNLYDYKIISGFVYPDIHEYAFTLDARLREYLAYPGDQVKKGAPLIRADEESLNDDIEKLQKSMDQAEESYLEQQEGLLEELADLNEKMGDVQKQYDELEEEKRKIPGDTDWGKSLRDYFNELLWNLDYQKEGIQIQIDRNRLYAQQAEQLYAMDTARERQKLEELQKKRDRYTIYSSVDGMVVAYRSDVMEGDSVWEGIEMIAVAGNEQKIIRCEYIKQTEVDKCEDLYAIINGVRYEVTYQPYTEGEYNRLLAKNDVVFSSFVVDDPQDQVKTGDYAVIVEILSDTGPVLTVPRSAMHRDELGYFVYCVADGESVPVHIRIGKSDGVYAQVLSGLDGGEVILLTDSSKYGPGSATVKRGSVSNDFSTRANMTFLSFSVVRNPVKYCTSYLTEMISEWFMRETVRSGDVIATVKVEKDDVALYEKQLELKRKNERLNEVLVERVIKQAEYDKEYADRDPDKETAHEREERQAAEKELANLAKDIERRLKAIDELTQEIEKLQADYETTQIRANANGILNWTRDYARNNILSPGVIIAYIADTDRSLYVASDEKHQLILGTPVTVEYRDTEGKIHTAESVVVSASNTALSKPLVPDKPYVQIPQDVIGDQSIMQLLYNQVNILADTRKMDNVLIIPRRAVYVMSGKTYVYVRNADGSVTARSFIAGGSNNDYYWVVEGLEEGMIICSE